MKIQYIKIWYVAKEDPKSKFTVVCILKKEERFQISELNFHLNSQEN